MAKAANIRKIVEDVVLVEPTVNILWDLVDNYDNILVADLITPEANFEAESKAVIASYIRDTEPAGETP